jgi:hypothetical protein
MSPTNGLDLVIDELIDEEPLAVLQLRDHRGSLHNDRLHGENPDQNKDDDDQEYVAEKSKALDPDTAFRFATRVHDVYPVIVEVVRVKGDLFILTEIEHNRVGWMSDEGAALTLSD